MRTWQLCLSLSVPPGRPQRQLAVPLLHLLRALFFHCFRLCCFVSGVVVFKNSFQLFHRKTSLYPGELELVPTEVKRLIIYGNTPTEGTVLCQGLRVYDGIVTLAVAFKYKAEVTTSCRTGGILVP